MPMPPYKIMCYEPGCAHEAVYKIAARWSDGVIQELKTYGLVCPQCLPKWFYRSRQRQRSTRRAREETLDPPGIYLLQRGVPDHQLPRCRDLEEQLLAQEQDPHKGTPH